MGNRPKQQIMTVIAIALTFGSGAMDVASFTRLGDVFTSVMTGNMVLWGLAAARRSVSLASHTAVSIAGYVAGVTFGTWIAHGFRKGRSGGDRVLEVHVIWALLTELVLLAGLAGGWEAAGGSPAGWTQFCLLAVAAAAMGVQSSTVRDMGLSDVSTTYLTGTLTGLVSSLASPGKDTTHGVRRFGVLLGLIAGAGLSGLLVATGADGVPALPLAALVVTLVLGSRRGLGGCGCGCGCGCGRLRARGGCGCGRLRARAAAGAGGCGRGRGATRNVTGGCQHVIP
jgi:uncharacterized membrane protein YoaK (UPF0700 family)